MKAAVPLLTISLAISCFGMSAPKPSVVQMPNQWTLEVEYQPLQEITMTSGKGGGSPLASPAASPRQERYWYLIVTVTNNTGDDVEFYPQCELMTDTFEIIPAGESVPPQVIESIKVRHKRLYPFLEALDASGMRILQGRDNTRDIVMVWPDFDAKARQISLFVSGLSNETVAVDNPAAKDNPEAPKKVFLRKTLEMDYTFKGDPEFRSTERMTFTGESWIMR
jgi:hypothetical protein